MEKTNEDIHLTYRKREVIYEKKLERLEIQYLLLEKNKYILEEVTLLIELCSRQILTKESKEAAELNLHTNKMTKILLNSRKLIPTGIKFCTLLKTYKRIVPRSRLAVKRINIEVEVVGRDYTGEIKIY